MKSRWWLNLALAALVLALGVLVWRGPAPQTDSFALSSLAPEAVTGLRIEKPGQPAIVLEKRGGLWRMTAPFSARGNQERITHLLDFLRTSSTRRLPAEHLERYDLDKPLLTLDFNGQRFIFGPTAPLDGKQYVASNGFIYLIDPRQAIGAYGRAGDFADPRLLENGAQPVAIDTGALSAKRDATGHWTLTPSNPELSQDALNRWADAWRTASARTVQTRTESAPQSAVRLTLQDGRSLELQVLSEKPDLTLARPDEKLEYHFPPEMADTLLHPH